MRVRDLYTGLGYHLPHYLPYSENRGKDYCSRDGMRVVREAFPDAPEDERKGLMMMMLAWGEGR